MILFLGHFSYSETLGQEQMTEYSDKMMNYIGINEKEIFKEQARLFPPGFPRNEDSSEFNIDQLGELVDDLSDKVERIQNKI